MVLKFLRFFVQREGKKFLELNEEIDEFKIVPFQARDREEASLYIHIPFCQVLCPYCSFNRYLFDEEKARTYFKHLKKELDLYIQKGFKFSHFYFGGGTPTILMDELTKFIDFLKENFQISQLSVETSPHLVNEENIRLLKTSGVNRLSIGVQSFQEKILKAVGRLFITEDAREKILIARDNFDTLNLDLIFNFPSQSIEQFMTDLEIFESLNLNQVTFYPLMPSPHKKNALERKFNQINTSREKKFYDIILKTMLAAGYSASTAWCFSKGERIIDEYIIDFIDYIGIGCGSVSYLKGNLFVNTFSLNKYGELLSNNKFPIIRWKTLSKMEQVRYYFLTKLFGLKLDIQKFYQKFNLDIHKTLRKDLMFLKLFGLIKEKAGRISVTQKGMYPVNMMMKHFYASLNGLREYCIENQI
jgi:coproporphyrinogen III oxidase-like Fe-S oxidoreductase